MHQHTQQEGQMIYVKEKPDLLTFADRHVMLHPGPGLVATAG
jgi:hypothetical protein